MESLLKHAVIIVFLFNMLACIITSYYLTDFVQLHCLQKQVDNAYILHLCIPLLCILCCIILHSYFYFIIALLFAPGGHDMNAYKIGRSCFSLYRVFSFMYSCFQSLHTMLYAKSYFSVICSFYSNCQRLSSHNADLNNMPYSSYSLSSLKGIVSMVNTRVSACVQSQKRLEKDYLSQAHYDDIVKHRPYEVRKCVQSNQYQMVSLFNIHFDPNDADRVANIFLPPFDKHTASPTPCIIFLVGGAWGSCDITFSASAASSFVTSS